MSGQRHGRDRDLSQAAGFQQRRRKRLLRRSGTSSITTSRNWRTCLFSCTTASAQRSTRSGSRRSKPGSRSRCAGSRRPAASRAPRWKTPPAIPSSRGAREPGRCRRRVYRPAGGTGLRTREIRNADRIRLHGSETRATRSHPKPCARATRSRSQPPPTLPHLSLQTHATPSSLNGSP